MYTLLTQQSIAHVLADYIFQPHGWCNVKENKVVSKEHFYHAIVVFVCSWTLSFQVSFWWAALIISATHLLLDMLKSFLLKKNILVRYLLY